MARAVGVPIDWRPFTLDIPSYLGSARLDEKGSVVKSERSTEQWSGVRYAYMDARRYANLTGKVVRGTVKIWDSSLAGISMLWAKRHGQLDRYLDVIYPPFWRRELDIEDLAVLESVLDAAGVPIERFREFAAGEGRAEHDAINDTAFAAGVFGVPTYLVGDELWFGREHLPRVAWLLEGAQGSPPEVANRSFSVRPRAETKIDAAHLTVLLDLRNPASYLALEPAAEFAEERSIEVDWLPVTVPPLKPASLPGPDDDRSILHRRHRARALAREYEVYGRAQGLELRELYRDGDATAFELGWLWLRESKPTNLLAYLREGFRSYWSVGLDPASVSEVRALVGSVGGDGAAFEAWCETEGPAALARIAAELKEQGAGGAPGYLVEGEFFQGRQHLPMIRWILEGRIGPGPI
jgi:2-hydroxychromene-2-carboxylate isomerase